MTDTADRSKLTVPDYIQSKQNEDPDGKLWSRYAALIESSVLQEVPPFPRTVLLEVANICNHQCSFCAYTKMTRPSRNIDPEVFKSVVRQAHDLGAEEIGLHGGSEPLTCKKLEEHIAFCAEVGYRYIYFTTNGSLADEARFKRLIDAGTSSIKISINAGDRETYTRIHGRDDFDKVARNVEFIDAYRKTLGRPLYFAISFVEVEENKDSFPLLKQRFAHLVDEIFHVAASNQSGQMLNLPVSPYMPETCQIPFNQVNISREGYLRACCNDYQNHLAIEDLTKMTLAEAWASPRFRKLRRGHLENDLEGTLCHTCIRGCTAPVRPLNPALGDWGPLKSQHPSETRQAKAQEAAEAPAPVKVQGGTG